MVLSIGEVDLFTEQPDAGWRGKLAQIGGDVVARVGEGTVSGEGCDHTIGVYASQAMVEPVGDVDVACRVDVDGARKGELGIGREVPIAREPADAGSGRGADRRIAGGNRADSMIAAVCDVEIPGCVGVDIGRTREFCRRRCPSIAAKS